MKKGPFDTNLDIAFKKLDEGQITNADQLFRELEKKRDFKTQPFAVQAQPSLQQFLNPSQVIPILDPDDYRSNADRRTDYSRKKGPDDLKKEIKVMESFLREKKSQANQFKDLIDEALCNESSTSDRVDSLYCLGFIHEDYIEKHTDPQSLLPDKTYRKIRDLYRKYRPKDKLPYLTYLISAQSALGCFAPRGAKAAVNMIQTLIEKLKGAQITLTPVICILSHPDITGINPEVGQDMLDRITVRFIRQLALDLLYKDKETYKPDKKLKEQIFELYRTIKDEPSPNISNIFPFVDDTTGESYVDGVTQDEYIFTVALGNCLAASSKDRVRTKLINIITKTVFEMPPGSLKRISNRVFEMIDENSDPALTHLLAAHFVLESLTEGFWLAATSPYAAYIHYLTDKVWFDLEFFRSRPECQSHEEQESEDKPDLEEQSEQDTLTTEQARFGVTGVDDGVLESLGVGFMIDPETLLSSNPAEGVMHLIDKACKTTESSESVKLKTFEKVIGLLFSEIRHQNMRLDAWERQMPDVETKNSRKEHKKLTSENEKIKNELDSLTTELSELKDSYQKDCEKNFSKGQKQTQSILYPELVNLRKELEEERKKNASLLSDQKELIQLRELIFNDQADSEESQRNEMEPLTAAEEDEIREFIDKNKLVFVGGHIRQNRDFEQKYGHITIANTPTFPPEAVANADLLVVFAHWVSHTTYYKATGIAKRKGTPVEYINTRNTQYSERELLDIIRKHS